jgi:4'-phosphopantetheinyl transferase
MQHDGPAVPDAQHGERASTVHVWIQSITALEPDRDALLAMLTVGERERMYRFRRDVDRMRFLVGRTTLRREVAAWRGMTPLEIPLTWGPQGKPLITGGPHVNVTHSGDLVGVALCSEAPIGLDIEMCDPANQERARLDMFFSPSEIAAHLAMPEELRLASFFHIWTSKEALLKTAATGLSLSLQSFDVAVDPRQPPALLAVRCEELRRPVSVLRLDVPDGYAATLAVFAAQCEVVYRARA